MPPLSSILDAQLQLQDVLHPRFGGHGFHPIVLAAFYHQSRDPQETGANIEDSPSRIPNLPKDGPSGKPQIRSSKSPPM
jgi:hypothetical protein